MQRPPPGSSLSKPRGTAGSTAASVVRGASRGGSSALTLAGAASRGKDEGRPALLYCSFDVDGRCKYALATRVCHECRRFDPTGTGAHCERCFASRHPWFRTEHAFTLLSQRVPTPPRMKAANAVAERTVVEAGALLGRARAQEASLGAPLASHAPALTAAASECDALLARMAAAMLQLRDPGYQARHGAARRVQLCWRGRFARRWWRLASRVLWGRMRDPSSGDVFYVNVATLVTAWEPPRVFGRVVRPEGFRVVFPCSLSAVAAATVVQCAARRFVARRHVARLIARVWRRCLILRQTAALVPAASGAADRLRFPTHYYYNVVRRVRVRERPTVLFDVEPELYGEHVDDVKAVLAAKVLQNFARHMLTRDLFVDMLFMRWEKVWNDAYACYFYYNRVTGESQWNVPMPRLLGKREFPTNNRAEVEAAAAAIIHSFFRAIVGRARARAAAAARWRRIWDPNQGAAFYVDAYTGVAQWRPPPVLAILRCELPLENPEEDGDSAQGGVSTSESQRGSSSSTPRLSLPASSLWGAEQPPSQGSNSSSNSLVRGAGAERPPPQQPPTPAQVAASAARNGSGVSFARTGSDVPSLARGGGSFAGSLRRLDSDASLALGSPLHRGASDASLMHRGASDASLLHRGASSTSLQSGTSSASLMHRGASDATLMHRNASNASLMHRSSSSAAVAADEPLSEPSRRAPAKSALKRSESTRSSANESPRALAGDIAGVANVAFATQEGAAQPLRGAAASKRGAGIGSSRRTVAEGALAVHLSRGGSMRDLVSSNSAR